MRNVKSTSKKVFPVKRQLILTTMNNQSVPDSQMRKFKSQDIYSVTTANSKYENYQRRTINLIRENDSNVNLVQEAEILPKKASIKNLSISHSKRLITPKKSDMGIIKQIRTFSPNDNCGHNKTQNKTKGKGKSKEKGKKVNAMCKSYEIKDTLSNMIFLSSRELQQPTIPLGNIINDESIQEMETEDNSKTSPLYNNHSLVNNQIEEEEEGEGNDHKKGNYDLNTQFNTNEVKAMTDTPTSKKIKFIMNNIPSEKSNTNGNSLNYSTRKKSKDNKTTNRSAFNNTKKIIQISLDENNHQYNQDDSNDSLLRQFHQMARKGDKEAFLDLFEKVLNKGQQLINYQDEEGSTALHYASEEGNLKIVDILIKGNADINIKSKNKKTPLHLSSQQGYFDISKLLIQNEAIINSQDNEKNTPIHLCVIGQHIELLKYLLEKSPQIDLKNIYGKTPYDLSSNNEQIKQLLTDHMKKSENQYHKVRIYTADNSQAITMFSRVNELTPKPSPSKAKIIGGINAPSSPEKKKIMHMTHQHNHSNTTTQNNNININISAKMCNVVNIEHQPSKKNLKDTNHNKTMNNKEINSYTKKYGVNNNMFSPTKNINQFLTSKPKQNSKGLFDTPKKRKPIPLLTVGNTNHCTTMNNEVKVTNVEINLTENIKESDEEKKELHTPEMIEIVNELPEEDNNNSNDDIGEEKVTPSMFIIHGLLGKGSFGEVYLVEKKNNPSLFAMKVLNKEFIMAQNIVKYAMSERNILSMTSHPFIVKLNYAFQTTEQLFLILDYCPGGDLSQYLSLEKRFSEDRAKIYLCEIILAIGDLHKRNIIFRDLKPDNVVLDKDGHALLTDFGLSKEGINDGNNTKSFCGSIAYLAPEMLRKRGHGKSVDCYLLGVLFYEMLVGFPPYFTNDKNIEKGELHIPKFISNKAKELIKDLLQKDINQRLGSKNDIEEVMKHDYFSDINWKDVYDRKLKPPKPKVDKFVQNFSYPRTILEDDIDTNNEDNAKVKQLHFDGWSFIQHEQSLPNNYQHHHSNQV